VDWGKVYKHGNGDGDEEDFEFDGR